MSTTDGEGGGGGGGESSSTVAADTCKIANRNLRKQLIIDVPPLFEPILCDIDYLIKTETLLSSFDSSRRKQIRGERTMHLSKSNRFNKLLDFYQECTESKKPRPVSINLVPELNVEISEQDSEVFVHLTWMIRDLNKNQMVSANDWSSLNIAEYELYGYKSKTDESLSTLDPAQLFSIGTMQPHVPPVTCTLSDFLIDHVYFLTVRIRYNDNTHSEYSNLKRVYVSRAQNDLSF